MKRFSLFFLILLISFPFYLYSLDEISSAQVAGYLRGFLYIQDGKYQQAFQEFEKLKRLDPNSSHLHLKTGLLLLKLGKTSEAEVAFKKAKELDSNNLDASVALIFLYAGEKRTKELESEYQYFLEKAHQLRPENIKISEYLGQFYFYKKMPQQAIRVYQTIVKQKPDYADGYFWLGYFYEEINDRKKAIQMWKKTIKLNPNHADALNSLGYIYAEEGLNLDDAERLIKKALEKDPNNGAYLDSLGWVYFKKRDYQKAKEFLLKALNYLEESTIYEHLGDLYIRLKDFKEGLRYYREGLKLDKDNVSLKKKVEKYERRIKATLQDR
ncbi:MAG: tetratricopeptide repeat protein [Candidatus Omnitrophica bacterium]|nr:tetratricopeptide repeat protein [Candidatus Omnitrophota bacterium]